MSWWVGSILANVCITAIEYLNRTASFASPVDAFKVTGPIIVLAQVGLFYAWKGAPSFMLAWAAFFAGSMLLRLVSNYVLVSEPLTPLAWAGVVFVVGGAVLVKAGS